MRREVCRARAVQDARRCGWVVRQAWEGCIVTGVGLGVENAAQSQCFSVCVGCNTAAPGGCPRLCYLCFHDPKSRVALCYGVLLVIQEFVYNKVLSSGEPVRRCCSTMKNKRKRTEREPVVTAVDEAQEVAELVKQVLATAPARGTQPFTESRRNRESFATLPLSQRTIRGLADKGFKTMTEIQVRIPRTRQQAHTRYSKQDLNLTVQRRHNTRGQMEYGRPAGLRGTLGIRVSLYHKRLALLE